MLPQSMHLIWKLWRLFHCRRLTLRMFEKNTEKKERNENSEQSEYIKKQTDASYKSPVRKIHRNLIRRALSLAASLALFLVFLTAVVFALYKYGYFDSYIEDRFTAAFDEMGIEFKSGHFRVSASPFKLSIKDAEFKDKKTGEKLFRVGEGTFDIKVLDLYALKSERNVVVKATELKDLEVWINFDQNGNSNYSNIKILPPKSSVKLQYTSSKLNISNGLIHFGNIKRTIRGSAKNMTLLIEPENDRNSSDQKLYKFDFAVEKSNFAYNENKVEPLSIKARGIVHNKGAEIEKLRLTSPLTTSNLSGTLKDWKAFKYDLKINSTVDLTKTSEVFALGIPLKGVGDFEGTVKGEGERYKIEGEIISQSLLASNVKLKALRTNATVNGENTIYNVHGKAVAELLAFKDFKIEFPRLISNIRGTGTDFKWFGELRSAAAKSPLGTIAGLYISDAIAEYEDEKLHAHLGEFRAASLSSFRSKISSVFAENVKIDFANGITSALIPNAVADNVNFKRSKLKGVSINSGRIKNNSSKMNISLRDVHVNDWETTNTRFKNTEAKDVIVHSQNGSTKISVENMQSEGMETRNSKFGKIDAAKVDVKIAGNGAEIYSNNVKVAKISNGSAILGSLNVAGVRLTVRRGKIKVHSSDFDAGNIKLHGNGNLEDVKVYKPVFVLEPSGRYRASLDMSLGSGILGSIKLGEAKAAVIADNDKIQFNKLTATVADGQAKGNVIISLTDNFDSEIKVNFTDLSLAKLLALQGRRVMPIEGKIDGKADFTFRGTDFRRLSGMLTAKISASGNETDRGMIPMMGKIGVRAINGLFNIDSASLKTTKSTLNATGKFDLGGGVSKINLAIHSSDAGELDRMVRGVKISPELERRLDSYEAKFVGSFAFNGNITGNLSDPSIEGKVSLASLFLHGKNLGSISSEILVSPGALKFRNGVLKEAEGRNLVFDVKIPRFGTDNTSVKAKLNNVSAGSILTALFSKSLPKSLQNLKAQTSGALDLSGLPNRMHGKANLIAKDGVIEGQFFDNLKMKVVFTGPLISIEELNVKFGDGILTAQGTYETDATLFKFKAHGKKISIPRILAFFPESSNIPKIEGNINIKASASGNSSDTSTYNFNFDGKGENIFINRNPIEDINFFGETKDRTLNANLALSFQRQTQIVKARIDFADENMPLKAETTFDNVNLAPYINSFRKSTSETIEIGGIVSGKVLLQGNLIKLGRDGKLVLTYENLNGTANFKRFDLNIDETPLNAVQPVMIRFNMNEASIKTVKFASGGSNLVVSGTKALNDDEMNNFRVNGKINLRILNILSKNVFFKGFADIGMRLTGINKSARLNGTAKVQNTSVATFLGSERITFERLSGNVLFTKNQIQIEQIKGFLGGGKINLTGGASLKGLELDRFRLDLMGSNITARLPAGFTTTGNANMEISGKRKNDIMDTLISGTVYVKQSVYRKDIDFADLVSGKRETSLSRSAAGVSVIRAPKLNLRVLGRNALLIRNNLADLTASANLLVIGDVESPQISGRITANSGTLFFSDERYDLQRGVLTFPPDETNVEPIVNMQVETEIRGYRISVNLSGSLRKLDSLTASVRSNPALPQADVVSLITTGSLSNTANGIPTLAQSGINTATEILTDEIINLPVSRATDKLFGLNKFSLDPIISGTRRGPAARLTVGRKINKNLLITYSINLSEDQNQVITFEYRLSNRLSFVTQYEQRSLANITQNRNNFNFEVRLRKRF